MKSWLEKGQIVRVRRLDSNDDWCVGRVSLASPNGKSIMLELDGIVRTQGGFVAEYLPLSIDYEQETVTDLFGGEYEIEISASLS